MHIEVRPAADRADALRLLVAVERFAVDGSTAEDMAAGCELLDVLENGELVGVAAVEVTGDSATIKAATNTGRGTYLALMLIEADLKARGVRRVGLFTRRAGLVRTLLAHGYRIREAELKKDI